MSYEHYLLPVIVAFWLTVIIVPLARLLALKLNIVDKPEARKLHKEPTPLLGGLGIFITFVITLLLFYKGSTNLNLKGVIIGGGLIVVVGLWDDLTKGGLSWRVKLFWQLVIAALVVLFFDIRTSIFNIGLLNICVTALWLVFITNSLNLLDNMDGLSAGIAGIAGLFYFLLAYKSAQYDLAMFVLLFATVALTFLKYNFSPASIFMGDTGSMFLGFTLGCVAVQLQVTEFSKWQLIMEYSRQIQESGLYILFASLITSLIPIMVLGIPVFDTLLVMVLRVLNGLKISTPGRDHSSHRLMQLKGKIQRKIDKLILLIIRATGRRKKAQYHILKGIAHTRTVLILYACAAALGLAALIVPQLTARGIIWLLAMLVIIAYFSAARLAEVRVYKK